MRFSILIALAAVATFAFLLIKATCGEHSVIVFGLLGFVALHLFFKFVVNAN